MAVEWEVSTGEPGERLQQAAGAAFGGEADDLEPSSIGLRRVVYAWALAMTLVGLYIAARHAL